MEDHLKGLNAKQREATTHINGPLLIVAGAGAGKTKTITHRILNLIKNGVAPEKILAVTFTNKAAKEMKERITTLLSRMPLDTESEAGPFISTFHSLGVYIIKENARLLGLTRHFTILDESDSTTMVKEAIKEIGLDPKQYDPKKIGNIISREKGKFTNLAHYEEKVSLSFGEGGEGSFGKIVAEVWNLYEKKKAKENSLDFDDLLLKAAKLLKENEEIRKIYQEKWDYIHIDEYQDTNEVQYLMSKLLSENNKNICVVGDMDQCLIKGTKIKMADNTLKSIENVKKNDFVLSNYGSGDFRSAKVIRIKKLQFKGDIIQIKTEKGLTLTSTPEHIHFAGYRVGLTPQTHNLNRRNINITLCADRRGKNPMHLISMHGNDDLGRKKLKSFGFSIRSATKNAKDNWRFETVLADYGQACLLATKINSIFPEANLVFKARMGKNMGKLRENSSLPCIPASSIMAGMAIFTINGYDTISKISKIQKQNTKVFDLDIEKTHNFIANDILTHNCIYSWRGANLKNILSFEKDFGKDTKIILLEENYRSTQNILEAANEVIKKNKYRPDKNLFTKNPVGEKIGFYEALDENDEAEFVATKILELLDSKDSSNFSSLRPSLSTGWDPREAQNRKSLLNPDNSENVLLRGVSQADEPRGSAPRTRGDSDPAEAAFSLLSELSEIAILYRANFQSRALEEAMLRYNIPYQVLGVKFFERKEIKDTLAYLRAALNPESLSDIKRIINFPARGIGKATLAKIFAGEKESLPIKTKIKIDNFYKILEEIKSKIETEKVSEVIKFTVQKSGIETELSTGTEEDIERLENIKELATLALKYNDLKGGAGVEKLLENASLASDQDSLINYQGESLIKDGVKLMTVHASKGLEFKYVFITGLEDGLFPHQRNGEMKSAEDKEEERRLFYVALTRAKEKLFLSFANFRTIFGSRQINTLSEFISDIPSDIIEKEGEQGKIKTIYI